MELNIRKLNLQQQRCDTIDKTYGFSLVSVGWLHYRDKIIILVVSCQGPLKSGWYNEVLNSVHQLFLYRIRYWSCIDSKVKLTIHKKSTHLVIDWLMIEKVGLWFLFNLKRVRYLTSAFWSDHTDQFIDCYIFSSLLLNMLPAVQKRASICQKLNTNFSNKGGSLVNSTHSTDDRTIEKLISFALQHQQQQQKSQFQTLKPSNKTRH